MIAAIRIFPLLFFLTFAQGRILAQEEGDNLDFKELEESGKYKQALLLAGKKLESDSLNPGLWTEVAKLYRLNQNFKQSIAACERAIKLDPENHKNIILLARLNKLAGKNDAAQKIYRNFLETEPENIMALSDLAEIYMAAKMPDSAANTYKKLYMIDSLNVDYLYKWANNQWNSSNYTESMANYRKALLLDVYYLPVIYDLSRIYVKMRMQDSALSILEKNILHYPEESGLYAEMGHALFSSSDYKTAIQHFEKAIKMGQGGFELYRRLAISYYSVKDYEKSKETFELLITKDTLDYKICLYLGHLYNILGEAEKGLDFLNRSLSLITPDSMTITTIYSGIVTSYQLLKKYPEQINAILKRHEIMPDSYRSGKHLEEIAEIYENNLKNKEKALEYYQEYYHIIKDLSWLSKESKNKILNKINNLQKMIDSKK